MWKVDLYRGAHHDARIAARQAWTGLLCAMLASVAKGEGSVTGGERQWEPRPECGTCFRQAKRCDWCRNRCDPRTLEMDTCRCDCHYDEGRGR